MFNFKSRDMVEDIFGDRGRVIELTKHGNVKVRVNGDDVIYGPDELYLIERPQYDEDDLPEQVNDDN